MVRRFALQAAARHLLPQHGVQGCLRNLAFGRKEVELWHIPATATMRPSARFGGLQTCHSVWACPCCATKISERRKKDIEAALIAADALGWGVVMVTYTLRHNIRQSLRELITGLMKARSVATAGSPGQKLYQRGGVMGTIRAVEVTYGENGWHPHVHELVFLEDAGDLERTCKFLAGIRSQWDKGIAKAGLDAVNERGVDFQFANTSIAEYVAKFGHDRSWNVEHELTKQVTKSGKQGGRTPTDLLAEFAFDGDVESGDLWREYAHGMQGRRQLRWSDGLRALLFPADPDEKTDEELAEESDQMGVLLASITWPVWKIILADDARAQLLNLAATGDELAVREYLAPYEELALQQDRERQSWRFHFVGRRGNGGSSRRQRADGDPGERRGDGRT